MASVLETLDGLEGKVQNNSKNLDANLSMTKRETYKFAEKVFKIMDNDRDGEIEVSEFITGYQKLKARQNSTSSVTVTAYVREIMKDKTVKKSLDLPPPVTRRKSLKDSGQVKALFAKTDAPADIPEADIEA